MVPLIWTSIVVSHDGLLTGSPDWTAESLLGPLQTGRRELTLDPGPGLILGVCCLGHP